MTLLWDVVCCACAVFNVASVLIRGRHVRHLRSELARADKAILGLKEDRWASLEEEEDGKRKRDRRGRFLSAASPDHLVSVEVLEGDGSWSQIGLCRQRDADAFTTDWLTKRAFEAGVPLRAQFRMVKK